MDVTGKWYLSPGDIPAPFVYPLTLNADGSTDYKNARDEAATWAIHGSELTIAWGELGPGKQSLVFKIGDEREMVSGEIRRQHDLEDEEEEKAEAARLGEEYTFPNYTIDACALMRDPGGLEVVDQDLTSDGTAASIDNQRLDDVAAKLGEWLRNDVTFHDEQLALLL